MPQLTRKRSAKQLHAETLEERAVPATLVNSNTISYQDVDGDTVIVSFSKPLLTEENVNTMFTFDAGTVDGDNSNRQQLRTINLAGNRQARNTNVTVVVASPGAGSDGLVNVGRINATAIDLGDVFVRGDIGVIDAGDFNTLTTGVRSVSVDSIGRYGTATQGSGNLGSLIRGRLGALYVAGDMVDGAIVVMSDPGGTIGSIVVTGDVNGEIFGGRGVKSISIGGDLNGSIRIEGSIGDLFVSGSIADGLTTLGIPQRIWIWNSARSLRIGGDVAGEVEIEGNVRDVHIGGSILGGGLKIKKSAQNMFIDGDVVGGTTFTSGSVFLLNSANIVRVGGSVIGGTAESAGGVWINKRVNEITIADSVVGGDFKLSGYVYVDGSVGRLTIHHDVIGGGGFASGLVQIDGHVQTLNIFGDAIGGAGERSAQVDVWSAGSYSIWGNLVGGTGLDSGDAFLGPTKTFFLGGNLVGGDVRGGNVYLYKGAGLITVGGSLIGGTDQSTGRLSITGSAQRIHVGGDVRGGVATADGQSLRSTGEIVVSGNLTELVIGGSVLGGDANSFAITDMAGSGAVAIGGNLGKMTVGGDILGRTQRARIAVAGTANRGYTIGEILVGGRVQDAEILAGYNQVQAAQPNPVNPRASIRAVNIQGDLIASNIVAGLGLAKPISRIDSIRIGGIVEGTPDAGDSFRISAQLIGFVSINNLIIGPLISGPRNDEIEVGTNGDFVITEI